MGERACDGYAMQNIVDQIVHTSRGVDCDSSPRHQYLRVLGVSAICCLNMYREQVEEFIACLAGRRTYRASRNLLWSRLAKGCVMPMLCRMLAIG